MGWSIKESSGKKTLFNSIFKRSGGRGGQNGGRRGGIGRNRKTRGGKCVKSMGREIIDILLSNVQL